MEKIQVQVNVYVGAILNSTKGGWITLPMEEEALREKIASFNYGDAEYEIMDLETEMPVDFSQYRSVFKLNQDLKLFQAFEERGQLMPLMTAYSFRDEDLESAIELLEQGNYEYYEGVTDERTLGEAIVESGKLGWLLSTPEAFEHLPEVKQMKKRNSLQLKMVSQYLDYEAIGHDWTCNGCIIYDRLKTAMMEVPAE